MAKAASQAGFWVRCSPTDPSWSLATPEGRRTYYRRVGELATAAYAADRARGVDRFGHKLAPLAPRTIKYRRSAMGKANKTAPPFIPAGTLSRTNAFLRRRPEEDGVWFFWRNDPRVRRSWGDILYFHANGLVHNTPVRDVLGLSPRAQKEVAKQANAWWHANKKRFTPGVVNARPDSEGKVYIQARHVEGHTVGTRPLERNKRTGLHEGLYQYRGPQAPAPDWALKAYEQFERKGLTTYSATPARLRKPEAIATLATLRPDESRKPATAAPLLRGAEARALARVRNRSLTRDERRIAARVGDKATSGTKRFAAEVHAGLRAGMTFDEAVLALYRLILGGRS